jgi:hypothetical protein
MGMRLLSTRAHGWFDWAAAAVFAVAPPAIGFGGPPAKLCWIAASAHLFGALSAATSRGARPPPSLLHASVEGATALMLLAVPWLFDVDAHAAIFFLLAGLALGLAWLASDYGAAERARSTRAAAPARGSPPSARRVTSSSAPAERPTFRVVREDGPPAA